MFFSLVTLAVACAIAYVAWQQWRLARHRFRLDLFERRYKVYDATKKFVSLGQFDDPQLFEFNAGTADAEFLFVRSTSRAPLIWGAKLQIQRPRNLPARLRSHLVLQE